MIDFMKVVSAVLLSFFIVDNCGKFSFILSLMLKRVLC